MFKIKNDNINYTEYLARKSKLHIKSFLGVVDIKVFKSDKTGARFAQTYFVFF